MTPTLAEFLDDLTQIKNILKLFEALRGFSGVDFELLLQKSLEESEWGKAATRMHQSVRSYHAPMRILPGTLILYLAGHFENYVRTVVEELCFDIATACGSYDKLPKSMKDNLLKYTAIVIAEPRKYGHGENGVASFIRNLDANVNNMDVSEVNRQCISITFENMRPEILSELFERIGAKSIWDSIGQQNNIKLFFETHDAGHARSEAQKLLNILMDTRNKIAHPVRELTWPDSNTVARFIEYCGELAIAIDGFAKVYLVQVRSNQQAGKVETAKAI